MKAYISLSETINNLRMQESDVSILHPEKNQLTSPSKKDDYKKNRHSKKIHAF